jgi:predicted PurR-regulated permease PerM
MTGAAGVAVTVGGVELVLTARDVLVLVGLALFLSVGLEPAVSWLARRRFPRPAAVAVVCLAVLVVVVGGFLAAAIPPLITQATAFAANAPHYLQVLQDHTSLLGRLNDRFHLQQRLAQSLNTDPSNIASGLLGAGAVVLSALSSTVVVVVLTVYFLADLPRLRRACYRLVPHSRRPRAILIGDTIVSKIGGYVLGNLVTSLIAGIATLGWALVCGVPYPLLLGLMVALLDLVPVVGSTLAGVIVCLVALTVSLPVTLATAGFFLVYRVIEDYLLFPRIIGKAVEVPALVTVVALLIGGVLLGLIGALVAIPVAAAVLLIVREILIPRLDQA